MLFPLPPIPVISEEEQKEIDAGIPIDHGTDRELTQKLERNYGKQGKEKRKVYEDELIYRELKWKFKATQTILGAEDETQHSGDEEIHTESQYDENDDDDLDWKGKSWKVLKSAANKIKEGIKKNMEKKK